LTGRVGEGNLLPLLNSLENPLNFFSIERLSIVFDGRGEVIDVLVSSCFQAAQE
jgi:hypothetical protein